MKRKDIKIRLDEKTHKALKVKTAQNGTTIQDATENAIKVYVGHKIPAKSQN
jgi:hypothetical protein